MFLKAISRLFALSALVVGAGFAGSAHAYSIRVDCYGTGGTPGWAKTGNTITISTKINNVWKDLCVMTPNSCASDTNISVFGNPRENICTNNNFLKKDVQEVRFTTNGNDRWFLDEWELFDATGSNFYGTDNNTGWCFSADGDGNSQHCLGGVGYRSKTWIGG